MRRAFLCAFVLLGALALEYAIDNASPSAGLRHVLVALVAVAALTIVVSGRARDIALMMASLCVGLAVLEAGLLHFQPRKAAWIDSGLRQQRPIVGFGAGRPGRYATREVAPDGHVIFDAVATIDDDLFRATKAPKGDGAIAFFGDSFTFGTGLDDKDTIAQAFADLTKQNIPVSSLSFPAWSPAQNLAMLQNGLDEAAYTKARRFVLMTGAWHMDRTACKADYVEGAPRYRLVGGSLTLDGACFVPGRLHRFLRGFALYRDIVEPRVTKVQKRDAESYFAIVDEFVRLAKQKYGVDTTLIVLPEQPGYLAQLGMDEAAYVARLERSGADVLVDPLPNGPGRNPYVIAGDGHPTGLANRALAKILLDHLTAKQPGLLPDGVAAIR